MFVEPSRITILRSAHGDTTEYLRVERTLLRSMDVDGGKSRMWGAAWGFLIGATAGAILGASADHPCDTPAKPGMDLTRWCDLSNGARVMGEFGGMLGAVAGFHIGINRWLSVSIKAR